MDALVLLREQAERVDSILTDVFAAVTSEQALWKSDNSTANTIAGSFLHMYYTEDALVQKRYGGQPTIFEAGGWQERLGYDPESPWAAAGPPDLAAYRAYARDVRAATTRYLDRLDPSDLEREIAGPRGSRPLSVSLSILLVIHKATHTGEISALLGIQGVKGFPF